MIDHAKGDPPMNVNKKKAKKLTVMGLTAALALTTVLSGFPVVSASASSLSVIERVDTSNNSGLIRSKYVDENGQEVTLSSQDSTGSARRRSAVYLPASYDSRDQGCVTPIKNQGVTGSCWAFAALKSLEADSILQNLSALANTDYSESHLTWYTYHHLTDSSNSLYGDYISLPTTDSGDCYNLGGNAYYASFILANWWGAISEEEAPFSAENNQALRKMVRSMSQKPDSFRTRSEIHLKDMSFYDPSDISGIKEAVMEHGAVDVSVYFDASNMYHDSATTSAYEDSYTSDDANHCVTIVGWDDSFNTYSGSAPAPGAWLIANNYGEKYTNSMDGYYWLSYYDTSLCEISTFEAESTDQYDTNFQYDGFGWGDLYEDTSDISFANVFTNGTDAARRLEAAGFYTAGDDQSYKIEVYRQPTGSDPDSGALIPQCTTYGTVPHSGYHTIPLSSPATVAAGETFSIVVTFYAEDGNTIYVPIEGQSTPLSTQYHSSSDQSYVYSDGAWMDNTSVTLGMHHLNMNNVCLKVLATTLSDTEPEESEEPTEAPSTEAPADTDRPSTGDVPPSVTPDSSSAPSPEISSRPSPASSASASASSSPSPSPKAPTASPVNTTAASPASSATVSPSPDTTSSGMVVVIQKKKVTLRKGKTVRIPIRVTPADSFRKLTFRSKNKKIATINKNGKIKAKKKGKTKIIIKTPDGIRTSIKVVVKKRK